MHHFSSPRIKNFTELQASTARNGRSMELSELLRYRHLLLAFCDYTGLVWKIRMEDGRVFQRYAIADGDGNQPNPFKIEWATVKVRMNECFFFSSIDLNNSLIFVILFSCRTVWCGLGL